MKAKCAVLLLAALAAWPAAAQTITAVTGTVLDPNGVPFSFAPVNVTLVPPSGGASPIVTATGSPVIMPMVPSTNATGTFSTNLVANASITPASTTYTFRVCPPPVAPPLGSGSGSCVTITGITIAGASQDLSSAFAAASPPSLVNTAGMNLARVATSSATAQGANITATTIYTVPANVPGTYRLTCYVVLTRAATTSSTLPACNVIYTDADTGVTNTIALTTSPTTNTVGTVGAAAATQVPGFQAAAGSNIQFSTSGFASSGATSMQYAIRVKLEDLGSP